MGKELAGCSKEHGEPARECQATGKNQQQRTTIPQHFAE